MVRNRIPADLAFINHTAYFIALALEKALPPFAKTPCAKVMKRLFYMSSAIGRLALRIDKHAIGKSYEFIIWRYFTVPCMDVSQFLFELNVCIVELSHASLDLKKLFSKGKD